jgi:PilZ domain
MAIIYMRNQGVILIDRRRYPRRPSETTRVYLHAQGESVMHCKVRDISRGGALILTDIVLPLALPVELAFTCLHTRQIVKIYRRSAYVARASEYGLVALRFDKRIGQPSP